MSTDLMKEIQILRFQVKMLCEALLPEKYRLEHLMIKLDWTEKDYADLNDIFLEYEGRINTSEPDCWIGFEPRMRKRFNIDHHGIRGIILALHDSGLWQKVCEQYAKDNPASELHRIIKKNP